MNFSELLQYTDQNYIHKDVRSSTALNLPKDSIIKKTPINNVTNENDLEIELSERTFQNNTQRDHRPVMKMDIMNTPISSTKLNTNKPMTLFH